MAEIKKEEVKYLALGHLAVREFQHMVAGPYFIFILYKSLLLKSNLTAEWSWASESVINSIPNAVQDFNRKPRGFILQKPSEG